jgi:hypothetical protein
MSETSCKVVRDLLTKKWIFVFRKDLKSAKPLCSGKLPLPPKDVHAPMMLRSEEGSCRQWRVSTKPMKRDFKVA